MTHLRMIVLVVAATLGALVLGAGKDAKVEPAQVSGGVRSVPPYPVIFLEMPAGPNKDVYLSNCITCHSQLYVLMQPRFSRATWTAEVDKMKNAYGAQIEDKNKPLIVDYLVSIRGSESGKTN
jgi:hypothetical protein